MAGRKRKALAVWRDYTADEMHAVSLIHAAFGTVTHITEAEFHRPWRGVPEATWPQCPECMTPWTAATWPVCGWCGERDRGRFS